MNGIIRHLEDAIQHDDNPVYRALKAYGWALRRDSRQFDVEFARVDALMEGLGPAAQAAATGFVKNWRVAGCAFSGGASEAFEGVQSIVGPIAESKDVANLLVLARSSSPGRA